VRQTSLTQPHANSYTNGKLKVDDFHVAVIIGWGEENGVKYWTVQNDFGTNWGEQGYIRVLRGVDEASIEWGRYGYCAVAAKF